MSLFITFEGIDGSGKSTQARLLKEHLESLGNRVTLTREPGGTKLAENIRELVLEGQGVSDVLTELLLITAGRRDHYLNLIKPELEKGSYVICDRFFDSSLVYQGMAKGLGIDTVMEVTNLAIGDFEPHLTLLLDTNPASINARMMERSEQNFYDKQDSKFHEEVRAGFLKLTAIFPERVKTILADRKIEEIHTEIKALVSKKMVSFEAYK